MAMEQDKIKAIIQYLLKKKGRTKKQFFIQCLVAISIGVPIGIFKERDYFVYKKCEEHLNRDITELQTRLEQKVSSICGKVSLYSYLDCEKRTMISYTREIVAQIQEEKKEEGLIDTLKDEICSYLTTEKKPIL